MNNIQCPCDNCQIKGICPNIQTDQSMNLRKIDCQPFAIYSRERRYPERNSEDCKWLLSGVMLDEDLRIDKDDLIEDLYMNHFRNSGFKKLHLYKEALSCILGNLVVNGNRNKPLSKPLQKSSRDKSEWFEQSVIDNILRILVENKYCLYWNGFVGHSSKYFLTSKLINKYYTTKTTAPVNYILMNKIDPTDDRKIPKSKKRKIYITPPYCKMLVSMTDDIKFINKLLYTATVKFTYDNAIHKRFEYVEQLNDLVKCGYLFKNGNDYEIDKNSLHIYRSFTRADYRYGGRFYTKIFQGIPSDVRSTITINGQPTVEIDFSAHHLRILYHKENIDFQGEIYVYAKSDKPNADRRLVHKKIAMIAINAENRKSALGAVINALKEDKEIGKFKSEIPTFGQLNKLYDEFLEYHKPIAKYVGADAGIWLQRLDSDIMNEILVDLAKLNIVALPIHDSVIVEKCYEDKLKESMTNNYRNILKFNPILEISNQ